MEKYLYPNHPSRFIICGSSCSGKSVLLRTSILNNNSEFEEIYIYSPSLHQDIYQKINKGFSNSIPFRILPIILNEEDINLVFLEICNDKDI